MKRLVTAVALLGMVTLGGGPGRAQPAPAEPEWVPREPEAQDDNEKQPRLQPCGANDPRRSLADFVPLLPGHVRLDSPFGPRHPLLTLFRFGGSGGAPLEIVPPVEWAPCAGWEPPHDC